MVSASLNQAAPAAQRAQPSDPPTAERKIYFYRVNNGLAASGKPLPFDPVPLLEQIEDLTWTSSGRYMTDPDGLITGCWVDDLRHPQKIRMGSIRRTALPQVEEGGRLSPLGISTDAGIADQVHIVFFDDNIVGADYNFYGPRLARLSEYIHEKAGELFKQVVLFDPLLKLDVLEELKKFGDIRLFNLKLRASFVDAVQRADQDLGSALAEAARLGQADELEVVLRPAPYSRRTLSERLLGVAKSLVEQGGLRYGISRFVVRGFNTETETVEELNLLNDRLISVRRIVLLDWRSRALDSASAYLAIQQAYDELYDELLLAAGLAGLAEPAL